LCMSCLMHRTRSCVHILHKERVRKLTVAVKTARWKKSFMDWTDLRQKIGLEFKFFVPSVHRRFLEFARL